MCYAAISSLDHNDRQVHLHTCVHKKANQMLFIITLTFYYNFHPVVEGPPLAASPAAHTLQNGDAGAQVPK